MNKYFIENKLTKQWLTIGGNSTNDPTHPGLVSFNTDAEAQHYLISQHCNDEWEVTEHEFVNNN